MRALAFVAVASTVAAASASAAAFPGQDARSGPAGADVAVGADVAAGSQRPPSSAVQFRLQVEEPTAGAGEGKPLATGDCGILNFALTLEHLESAFYRENLARFEWRDFRDAGVPDARRVRRALERVAAHERRHVEMLRAVISSSSCGTPLPPCKYSFGVEDVHGFMALAGVLEKVGVSAYDGGISLIENGDVQTAAATIATVEARHASFINSVSGLDPFPHDFETPLAGPAIVTLASSVIESCPFDIPSTLGAAPFKSLKVAGPAHVRSGREIELVFEGSHLEGRFCSFLYSDKSATMPYVPGCGCKVPKGAHGDIFVAVTKSNEVLTLKNTKNLIIAGPVVVNVDTVEQEDCEDYDHGQPTYGYSRRDDH